MAGGGIYTDYVCAPACRVRNSALKPNIRYARLSVSERACSTVRRHIIPPSICFYGRFRVFLLYVFGLWYMYKAPRSLSAVFRCFWLSTVTALWHSVMPLSDIMLWIRNFLLIVSLGFASAQFPYCTAERKTA